MSQPVVRPFYRHLGIEVVEVGNGRALVRMPDNPDLLNGRGDVHGGAIATLLDAALSNAARAALPPGHSSATIQFSAHYLVPGKGELTAEGVTLRAGTRVVTAEAKVTDADGVLVATALGTLKAIAPRRVKV
jgi:uncharacterized protein (TIGR00369 family)